MGAKGRISSLPRNPIPSPSRPKANVAGANFPLQGRGRVPRSRLCIAENYLTTGRSGCNTGRGSRKSSCVSLCPVAYSYLRTRY